MKKVFAFVFSLCLLVGVSTHTVFALSVSAPTKPTGFVSDFAHILSAEEISTLEAKLSQFEKETTNELAVVTIESLEGDTIENVAQEIFTVWGIGKADKNNGALLLVALDDRKARIHTGYGLEGALTDVGTSYVQSEVLTPAFRAGNYYEGIDQTIDRLIEMSKGEFTAPVDYGEDAPSGALSFPLFFFAFFILQWFVAIFARSKSWYAGGIFGGALGVANIIFNIFAFSIIANIIIAILVAVFGSLLDYAVSKNYQKIKSSGGSHPWWGGGGSSGSFGGGSSSSGGSFGGFGGGSSGGGGSSSSW